MTAPAGGAGLPASLVGLLSPGQLQQLAAQGGQGIQQEIARLSGRRLTQDTSLGGLLASVAGQPGYLVRCRWLGEANFCSEPDGCQDADGPAQRLHS